MLASMIFSMLLLTASHFFCGVLHLAFAFVFACAFACGNGSIDDTVVLRCVPKSSSPCGGIRTLADSACVHVGGRTRLVGSGIHWADSAGTLSTDLAFCVLGFFCVGGLVERALLPVVVACVVVVAVDFALGAFFAFGFPL